MNLLSQALRSAIDKRFAINKITTPLKEGYLVTLPAGFGEYDLERFKHQLMMAYHKLRYLSINSSHSIYTLFEHYLNLKTPFKWKLTTRYPSPIYQVEDSCPNCHLLYTLNLKYLFNLVMPKIPGLIHPIFEYDETTRSLRPMACYNFIFGAKPKLDDILPLAILDKVFADLTQMMDLNLRCAKQEYLSLLSNNRLPLELNRKIFIERLQGNGFSPEYLNCMAHEVESVYHSGHAQSYDPNDSAAHSSYMPLKNR